MYPKIRYLFGIPTNQSITIESAEQEEAYRLSGFHHDYIEAPAEEIDQERPKRGRPRLHKEDI